MSTLSSSERTASFIYSFTPSLSAITLPFSPGTIEYPASLYEEIVAFVGEAELDASKQLSLSVASSKSLSSTLHIV